MGHVNNQPSQRPGSELWRGALLALCVAVPLWLQACGGGGGSSSVGDTPPTASAPVLALFAGNLGGPGSRDATGAAAGFFDPKGIAVDTGGNVYVADSDNRTIRKITPAGVVTTLAGTAGVVGSADGTGPAASFNLPNGIATDGSGNVYVGDTGNYTIRRITPAGVVTTLAGSPGLAGTTNGTGAAARFWNPSGLSVDADSNVYVADLSNHTIRRVTPAGVVTTLAGTAGQYGSTDATGPAASFNFPMGVATDVSANLYVADLVNSTIRRITPAGVVTTLAGTAGQSGSTDGTGSAARFNYMNAIATDSNGNVYVADTLNHTIRKITPAGVVSTLAGTAQVIGSTDGAGAAASFWGPRNIASDAGGNLYVADTQNNLIRRITPAGLVSTLAGTVGQPSGSADGTGAAASFNTPNGIATDASGNAYVADSRNNLIRKITPAGEVTTLAGTANVAGGADGTGAAASFNLPSGITTDASGNVYVADTLNCTIRRITSAGVVSTFAGSREACGASDGTGSAASFSYPQGIATDASGNVYVADSHNYTVRKITPTGVVTTLAGTAGTIGHANGTGAAASFESLSAIALDANGNVYVADTSGNAIRKITSAGVVTTYADALSGVLEPMGLVMRGTSLYVAMRNGIAVLTVSP